MHRTDKYSEHSSIMWLVWRNGWVFVYELSGCRFESSCCYLKFGFPTCFQEGVSDIEAIIECRFTLKDKRDMIRKYCQMQRTDRYSQHSSIIWPVWLNARMFVYKLSGCGFESSYSYLNIGFRNCFQQGVPWHSGNYKMSIHSKMRTWNDRKIQSNGPCR